MKRNNHGFSLIEMIVVIAILGILVGGSFVAYSVVRSAAAGEIAETVGTGMSEIRMKTMTQVADGGWSLEVVDGAASGRMSLIRNHDGSITKTDTELDGFDMLYNSGVGFVSIDSFVITYEVDTGAVKKVVAGVTEQTTGTGILRISVNGRVKDIYIYFATGKYETK